MREQVSRVLNTADSGMLLSAGAEWTRWLCSVDGPAVFSHQCATESCSDRRPFQVDEESESKSDLTRQVAKAQAECSLWRNKYEQEGIAR